MNPNAAIGNYWCRGFAFLVPLSMRREAMITPEAGRYFWEFGVSLLVYPVDKSQQSGNGTSSI